MPQRHECRICSGPTELLHRGAGAAPSAADLSPTCHRPGLHGELRICRRCGTVSQPGLPEGEALLALYREMDDARYLDEEAGRRRTARRVLELIEAHAPRRGRLLDVGCGHGLLLDEARRRGWSVAGLEPSRAGRLHARALGLDIRDATLADLPARERFDAIVLADVLEHVTDPRAELETCARLLRPAGVACVVTPDPASLAARLAGARWWGFLPAHTHLLPRSTLRRVLVESGLEPVRDVGLRRTFTLAYWVGGLAERGGALGRLPGVVRENALGRRLVTLSLADERVVVARRGAVAERPAPAVAPVAAHSPAG